MKKVLSVFLAVVMVLGLASVAALYAFADECAYGVYGSAIVGNDDGVNYVCVVGTLSSADHDAETLQIELEFIQNQTTVRTFVEDIATVYTTVTGVASVNETTASAQAIEYIEGAAYVYAVKITGIPAGDYTVEATVTTVNADDETTVEDPVSIDFTIPGAETEAVSDTLTNENTYGKTGTSYEDWTLTGESGALYSGQSAGSFGTIQFRSKNNNSGVVTTKSGGKITEITVTFYTDETAVDRKVNIYGKNTAYASPADLYDSNKQGTQLGQLIFDGEEATYTLTIEGDYAFVGLRSDNGAIYLEEIVFTWNGEGGHGSGDDPVNPPVVEAVSDTLTNENTYNGNSTTYKEWTLTGESGALYSGQSAGQDGTIQLRSKNSNSGIVTTVSGGKITSIKVTFNSTTASGRIIDIYAKNSAYASPADLYDSNKQGDKLGALTYDGTTASYTLTVEGDYEFVGLRSNNGAVWLDEIVYTWNGEAGSGDDPVNPPTPTYETPEEIVNGLYELGNNETLPGGPYTLTGLVTAIPSPYSSEYNNITVTIVVEGMTDMPVDCFRMVGDDVAEIEIGDTITVSGELQNYYSSKTQTNTYEFRQGCTLDELVKQEIGDAPETVVVTNAEYPTLDSFTAEYPNLAPGLKSTGDVNVLVIPVSFTNSSYTGVRNKLEIAFNGTNEQTGWRSLAGYYEEVSFGNLHIHATITDIYDTGVAYDLSSGEVEVDDYKYLAEALQYFDDEYDYSEYDADGDGYIDCVYLVYLAPSDGNTDLWWAYTYVYQEDGDEELLLDDEGVFWYMWFSIEFFDETIYNDGDEEDDLGVEVNCETVIHETGHALGLDDYYDWVNGTNPGLGGLVMMDWNQGDHDPYSKAILGWINPTILKAGEYETVLDSYTRTGDALFIARAGNDSLFDEFYIITFYTPDGVNAIKAEKAVELGYDFGVLSQPGILVYHVNSTLKNDISDVLLYDVCEHNNGDETDRLIKVVEREACVEDGYAADSEWVLFGEGDSIRIIWNDGVNSHYTVQVGSVSDADGAEISVVWG